MAIPANYDLLSAIDLLFPGVVVQRNLIDAARARLVAKNAPLASSDVTGILAATPNYDSVVATPASLYPTPNAVYPTALPTYPTGLPRFPDSNPTPDGWSIVSDGKVVFGEGT